MHCFGIAECRLLSTCGPGMKCEHGQRSTKPKPSRAWRIACSNLGGVLRQAPAASASHFIEELAGHVGATERLGLGCHKARKHQEEHASHGADHGVSRAGGAQASCSRKKLAGSAVSRATCVRMRPA